MADTVKEKIGRTIVVQPLDLVDAVVQYNGESVIIPEHLVGQHIIDAVDEWLRGDSREYEATDNSRYAPKHYVDRLFKGVPKLNL